MLCNILHIEVYNPEAHLPAQSNQSIIVNLMFAGVFFVTNESIPVIKAGLEQLKTLLGPEAFNGRGLYSVLIKKSFC